MDTIPATDVVNIVCISAYCRDIRGESYRLRTKTGAGLAGMGVLLVPFGKYDSRVTKFITSLYDHVTVWRTNNTSLLDQHHETGRHRLATEV